MINAISQATMLLLRTLFKAIEFVSKLVVVVFACGIAFVIVVILPLHIAYLY